jgi:hypothetical protein
MTASRQLTGAVLVALSLALVPASASADSASEAELHYSLGLELYKQRRYEEALQHLIASNRLVPNPNVAFNVAQTYGLLHRDADAFNWYQTYLEFSTLDDDARERGTRALAALSPKVAVLEITTQPPVAELFVDRVELGSVGLSPRKIAVAAGERTVIARRDRHHTAQATATATVGVATPVAIVLAPIVGVLVVETRPAGATVRREESGESLGVTPLRRTLPLGELRLTIAKDGFVDQQRTAVVREEAETRLDLELTAAASRVAVLTVGGAPQGAKVRLDGRELGEVPLVAQGLTPGAFLLEVEANGLEGYTTRVVLEPGAATRADVHLEAPNGGRWRWLHWVGYGAGAASAIGGLIVGAVAVANRNAFYAVPSRSTYQLVGLENRAADGLVIAGLVTVALTFVLDRWVWPAAHTHGAVEIVR